MIAFVDRAASIEPFQGHFLLTLKSGDTESAFFLTRSRLLAMIASGTQAHQESEGRSVVATLPKPGGKRK